MGSMNAVWWIGGQGVVWRPELRSGGGGEAGGSGLNRQRWEPWMDLEPGRWEPWA